MGGGSDAYKADLLRRSLLDLQSESGGSDAGGGGGGGDGDGGGDEGSGAADAEGARRRGPAGAEEEDRDPRAGEGMYLDDVTRMGANGLPASSEGQRRATAIGAATLQQPAQDIGQGILNIDALAVAGDGGGFATPKVFVPWKASATRRGSDGAVIVNKKTHRPIMCVTEKEGTGLLVEVRPYVADYDKALISNLALVRLDLQRQVINVQTEAELAALADEVRFRREEHLSAIRASGADSRPVDSYPVAMDLEMPPGTPNRPQGSPVIMTLAFGAPRHAKVAVINLITLPECPGSIRALLMSSRCRILIAGKDDVGWLQRLVPRGDDGLPGDDAGSWYETFRD